jgi:hypothetical protein
MFWSIVILEMISLKLAGIIEGKNVFSAEAKNGSLPKRKKASAKRWSFSDALSMLNMII